jgi:CBS domain-containing protein
MEWADSGQTIVASSNNDLSTSRFSRVIDREPVAETRGRRPFLLASTGARAEAIGMTTPVDAATPPRVQDLMSREVVTLTRNDQLSLADDIMRLGRIRHLPVVDDEEHVVGILSQRDLFRGALARALGYGEHGERKVLDVFAVKEVMTTDVVTTSPDTPLAEAARVMLERKIGALPVTENGKLVGLVTESDFVALAARSRG